MPSQANSRRVEKVNVFRDPASLCGLGCMIERENEYDNADELDLSATCSPEKPRKRAGPSRPIPTPFD